MATQIISTAIIRPDDAALQMSLVKAELARLNAQRSAESQAIIQTMRKEIDANSAYVTQLRKSRNRLLAERSAARMKRPRLALADITDAIGKPLLIAWVLFWLAGEKLGLWILNTGRTTKKLPIVTPRGYRVYFAITVPLNAWLWYVAIYRLVAYIHYLNG